MMLICIAIIGMSVLVIMAIDIFTTMYIRPRYYFMLYPLIALLVGYIYHNRKDRIKWCLLSLLIVFTCFASARELPDVSARSLHHEDEQSYEISDDLLKNGYTTIYAEWGHGQDVAVASNGSINLGYWYTEEEPFDKVTHLCSLDIYDADPEHCAYLFVGEDDAEIGIAVAESVGVSLELMCSYPESDTYIYTAAENLMQLIG